MHFAEKNSALLAGFGLVNSHCFADTDEKKANRQKGNDFIARNGSRPFVTELYNNIFYETYKAKNQKLINKLIEQAALYTPDALIAANTTMANRAGKEDVLKTAQVPVLLINGKQDESAPFSLTAKQATYPPVADVHFHDPCKHMSIFEKKKETITAVGQFLKHSFKN